MEMAERRFRRRLVLVPSPLEGHLHPMLQLATLLHLSGFTITIIHTHFNVPKQVNYPNFHFVQIPAEGLSDELAAGEDHMAFLLALNASCEAPFRDRLAMELHASSRETVACIIVDAQLYFTRVVAEELRVPRIVLRTSSAASFVTFAAVPILRTKGYLPIQDHLLDTVIPELAPLRVRDLPQFKKSTPESAYKFLDLVVTETIRGSECVILNTFEALEHAELEQLRRQYKILVAAVGPLHKVSPNHSSCTRLPQDRSCMEWLDGQAAGSVLYVSFGSLACMEADDLVEIAWGLANSGRPFLWVIRPGSVRGTVEAALPREFEEETKGRGRTIRWASQKEVLRHPAVEGFWTHCGWNSIIESVCEGVPMLCSPCFGDQLGNARVVSHVWKVGIQMEGRLRRGEIAGAVGRLFSEGEGEEMRERVRKIKSDADCSIREGGSFHGSLNTLVDRIMSLNPS